MALYKSGAFTPLISGKIGGTIFSRNSGGSYMKNLAIPVNRNTTYQTTARALLAQFAQSWKTIGSTDQAAWNAFAAVNPVINRVGDSVTMSGFDAYCMVNCNLVNGGASSTPRPMLPFTVTAPTSLSATCVAGVTTLTFLPTPVPALTAYLVWGTAPQSLGKFYVENQYRLFKVFAPAAASPQVVTTFYNTRFGAPPLVAGARLFFAIQAVSLVNGATSQWLRASCLTT